MEFATVLIIIFIAFLVRATFGFGDALIAMPLLVLVIGIKTAAPLMALLAFVIGFLIFIRNRKSARIKITLKLVISGLLGIPLGLLYLSRINEGMINLILGLILVLFALFRLLKVKFSIDARSQNILVYPIGFISGMLGAAYNTNGPPVIMFLSSQKLRAVEFRATLQSYFLFLGTGVVAGHLAWGNVNKNVLIYFLGCLPVIFITFFIGEKWYRKMQNEKFFVWVYFVLLLLGLSLILKVIFY